MFQHSQTTSSKMVSVFGQRCSSSQKVRHTTKHNLCKYYNDLIFECLKVIRVLTERGACGNATCFNLHINTDYTNIARTVGRL